MPGVRSPRILGLCHRTPSHPWKLELEPQSGAGTRGKASLYNVKRGNAKGNDPDHLST